MKYSLGISNFLEEISFPFCCFPVFLCIDCRGRLSSLSLLFFGTLHSNGYIFPFLLCFSLLFFSQLSEEALQIAEKRKDTKGKGEGERKIHALDAEFQRIAKRDKKAFLNEQCKETEENNRMGNTRDLFKKIEIPREHSMQRWAQ